MGIRPDLTVGTITLTSGSATFTTSGAALIASKVAAGDTILLPAKGLMLVIDSITGENAGTLTNPCPAAAAGAGQPLRIRYQPDGSRYSAAVQALVELLASGNNEAFAGLALAADRLPYATGPNALALTPLTAFARSLLDDANAAALWTTIGATAPPDKAFRRGNILGTVSQAGGVPTGALIERGSNANGEYVRFADGTQICQGETTGIDITIPFNGIYRSNTGTASYPAAFSAPAVALCVDTASPNVWGSMNPIGSTASSVVLFFPTPLSGRAARWMVIGRWF